MSTAETNGLGGVVAGFDGSEQSRRAVWWAAGEAVSRGGPLRVVQAEAIPLATVGHAWGPVAGPGWVAAPGWDPVTLLGDDRVRRHTEEVLTALADEIRATAPGIIVSAAVEDGRPAAVLTAAAKRAEAELIVVGATGLGALPRMLLGSTAAELVHDAELPVAVVRGAQSEQATEDAPVVLGVDGTRASRQAVGFAFDFAARHRCPVQAVHAQSDWPLDVLTSAGLWDRGADRDVARDEIADRVLGEWRHRHPEVPVRLDIVDDRPARALMDHSEHARLLVVGSRGRGAVSRVLLGSVSHAAMYHASCPVVVVPAVDELGDFVLARLAEDEQRFAEGVLPRLDDAERRGRLRIMRTDDGAGLLMSADPVEAREERIPVPFPEKAAFIRQEVHDRRDEAMLGLVASAYDAHPDWRESWRT